jgi:sugar transferase (PEP-CTERM/EpsH1 system associated)
MTRRRIVHVVYSFSIGGLENVIVQLINRLPADQYEHIVLSLTTISDFKDRIERPDVRFIALYKPPGHAIPLYSTIFRLLRQLKPDVVHTCNLAALEILPIAWLAGVKTRIHAEHGWDAHDPDGTNPRYRKLRKLYRPFVSHYIAVSQDLDHYLETAIGIPATRRSLIANGVDTERFSPPAETPGPVEGCPFQPGQHWLVGTVGRMQTVKNQPYLARSFVLLAQRHPEVLANIRLVIIGDGPLKPEIEQILDAAGLSAYAWLPGARNDIPNILRMLGCFVLPSQVEGTSCTLQEAMASGLPSIATAVGGTPALLNQGAGVLVPPDDESQFADAIFKLWRDQALSATMGASARQQAQANFALEGMAHHYDKLFS